MGPDTINNVIAAVAAQVVTAITALVPVGQAVTGAFIVLSIVMLGVGLATGSSSFLSPIVRMAAAGAGTYWAITYWPDITTGTLDAARAATRLLLGGYDGPQTLFQMADNVAARMTIENSAISVWSPSTYGDAIATAIASIFVWIGLTVTGLLAVLAEFQLLIGAAVAPLILPALAFGFTQNIGWGAVTFMVSAGVRVVVMGAVSFIMANAVTAAVSVPGTDGSFTHEQMATLMGISLLTALVGFCCNSIARDLVTGSPGTLGWGSITTAVATIGGPAGVAAKDIQKAGVLGGGGSGGTVSARNAAGGVSAGRGAAGSAGGKVGVSSGTGSAFP